MNISSWNNWFAKVKKNSTLIESYISQDTQDFNNNVKDASTLTEQQTIRNIDFKPIWQKVNLLKFFIEHLCPLDEFLYKRCITLWNYFSASIDLKKFDDFQKLLKFFAMISKSVTHKLLTECKGLKIILYYFLIRK